MTLALALAGQFSGFKNALDASQRITNIQPNTVDYARAVSLGLTFPATSLQRDAAIAVARREAASVVAGFAGTVTAAVPAKTVGEPVSAQAASIDPELPQGIVEGKDRISRPVFRSKSGETIPVKASLFAALPKASASGGTASIGLSEGHAHDSASEIKSAMLRLASEAHSRNGRPAMSAQAISDYLSLYALRERVAGIGRAISSDTAEQTGGVWVANLAGDMDDALFQNGYAFGQQSFGALAGVDSVVQSVFSEDDTLVYGGFGGVFGTAPDYEASFSPVFDEVRGGTLGVFAVLENGPFSIGAMMRADSSETIVGPAANRIDFSSAMQVLKAEVVARYRFDVSDWAVEPSASLIYSAGQREVVGLTPAAPQIEEAESLRFQLGVRASGVVYNRAGTSVEPSVTITIAEEMRDSGDVAFLGGAPGAVADPIRGRTTGSVSIGVDVKDDSGWTGFVRADGQVSDDDKPSAGVSAGVKTQW